MTAANARQADTTNGSNGRKRTLERIRVGTALITSAFEVYVSAEILWFFLNGEHLHTAVREYWEERIAERTRHRASVSKTRDMIRDLPETDSSRQPYRIDEDPQA